MSDFKLDVYKDWTNEQLKTRCRELVGAVGECQVLIVSLYLYGVDSLSFDEQEKIKNIVRAYKE